MKTMLTMGFRRVLSVVLLPLALACNGADPVVKASQTGVQTAGGISNYTIAMSVTNRGSAKQPSNVRQFVDIFQEGIKRDTRSIPPLRPGQTFNTTYIYQRSADAGAGTTTLTLRLNMVQGGSNQNCSTANDSTTVTF